MSDNNAVRVTTEIEAISFAKYTTEKSGVYFVDKLVADGTIYRLLAAYNYVGNTVRVSENWIHIETVCKSAFNECQVLIVDGLSQTLNQLEIELLQDYARRGMIIVVVNYLIDNNNS